MPSTWGVGIIGASAGRGWAKLSHVPAVQQLAGFELVAVASGSQQKADEATKAFGARMGYANGKELIQDPNVDIVTIAVKVPDHRELVLAGLAARKHVYCEWPLGRNLAETEELAQAAREAGVHVVIGLQTRVNAALLRAQVLLASGAIGRVLSARVLSTTAAFGPKVEAELAFAEEAANGVTQVTRGFQSGRLALVLNGDLQSIDEGKVAAMLSEAANVAALYAALRDDISSGGATVPDFEHAVRLAKLVQDVLTSAQSGTRTRAVDWPT